MGLLDSPAMGTASDLQGRRAPDCMYEKKSSRGGIFLEENSLKTPVGKASGCWAAPWGMWQGPRGLQELCSDSSKSAPLCFHTVAAPGEPPMTGRTSILAFLPLL